jgi:membrane protein DedA with SNARE-associated domain
MDRLLQIIYRLGIVAIWVVALFWVAISGIGFSQGLSGQYDKSALIFIVGAPILAVVAHLLWRSVFGQKKK